MLNGHSLFVFQAVCIFWVTVSHCPPANLPIRFNQSFKLHTLSVAVKGYFILDKNVIFKIQISFFLLYVSGFRFQEMKHSFALGILIICILSFSRNICKRIYHLQHIFSIICHSFDPIPGSLETPANSTLDGRTTGKSYRVR